MNDDIPFPLVGSTLILGPSNVGKTRLTAAALERWLSDHGPNGVVVFEFGPEYRHDDEVLGGRLDRFVTVPNQCWHGVIEAYAPRAEGSTNGESAALAAANADRAAELFDAAPASPEAVFVNDATIPFQHPTGNPSMVTEYCDSAGLSVLNAFDSDELGSDDMVSRTEAQALRWFREWADRVVSIDGG